MANNSNSNGDEGLVISDIVKEYPNMLKIVIYHNSYKLPLNRDAIINKERRATKREDNVHRSLRRTKTAIQDIMLCNKFDLWCTFTYNCRSCIPKCDNNPCICTQANCKRFDMHYTRRTLQNWFRNQRKHSPDLKYLAVPEFHKNGAIHFHCLISGFNGRLKDSGKKTKHNQTVYNASGYYSGWTEFVKIGERFDSTSYEDDYNRVISYLTKYITKDMPLVYGKRRYLISENMTRPATVVNGVGLLGLNKIIRGHKPEYIDNYLEVQKHTKNAVITRDPQLQLF